MLQITETIETLDVRDRMSNVARVVLLSLALFPLLAPYDLLIVLKWNSYLNAFFVFAALISAGALTVSAFFVFAAFAGLNSMMRFDNKTKTFTFAASAPVVPIRGSTYPFAAIKTLDIRTHEWSEGAPSYSLRIEMADGREFSLSSSWSQEQTKDLLERVRSFLGNSPTE